jgi:acetyl esterase/lipase
MTAGSWRWWTGKLRRTRTYLRPRIDPVERAGLTSWLNPPELFLFVQMHPADRRHGLDVVRSLRAAGVTDRDVLLAGLVHDAGKGRTSLVPRVLHALSERYGEWIARAAFSLPPLAESMVRLQRHPELSARLASAAGCSPRTVELIRWQAAPRDPEGELLRDADEAN